MPTAVKLQQEYGDAIQVIFVEVQGHSMDEVLPFALKRKWLGSGVAWTTERPFRVDLNGIPNYALISPDGEVVSWGYSVADHKKVVDLIEGFVKSGPQRDDLPKPLVKVYEEFDEGEFAKAWKEADKVEAKHAEDAQLLRFLGDARREVRETVERRAQRIGWLVENGYPLLAEAQWKDLVKAVKDADELEALVADVTARIDTDEFADMKKAARSLVKMEQALYESGGKDGEKLAKKLRKFAEDHAGTPLATRATQLADVAAKAESVSA